MSFESKYLHLSYIFQTKSKTEYKQEIERLKEELREQQERETRKSREAEERRRRLEEENRRLKVRTESVEEELKQTVGWMPLNLSNLLKQN